MSLINTEIRRPSVRSLDYPDLLSERRTESIRSRTGTIEHPFLIDGEASYRDSSNEEVEGIHAIVDVKAKHKGTTPHGAVFIIMNAALGAAILTFPYATSQCGGIFSLLIMQYLFVILCAGPAMVVMGVCADVGGASVYQEVVEVMTGSKVAKYSCEVFIIALNFFAAIAFLVLIGDQGQEIVHYMIGDEKYQDNAELIRDLVILSMAGGVCFPLCMPRNVSFLTYPGLVSFASVCYVMGTVFVMYFLRTEEAVVTVSKPANLSAVFLVLPTVAFGYACHISAVPVYCALERRTTRGWVKVVATAMTLISMVYSVVGIFGYLTFGDMVCADVLLNYDFNNPAVFIARTGIMVSVMMSYPLVHFFARICYENLYRAARGWNVEYGVRTWTVRYYVQTTMWFIVTLLLAILIPGIDQLVNIIGSLGALFILGYPGLCFLGLALNKANHVPEHQLDINASEEEERISRRNDRIFIFAGCAYLVFCAFLFGLAFASGVEQMAGISTSGQVDNPQCYT